ncbi:MAG: MoaD/ThiS family protein [Spirochaetales bacterium]|nr:MoaD/ThiS family protein [Spirochaetales bacterium]
MSATAVIPWNLTAFTNKSKQVNVEGSTVGECLEHLVRQFPEMKPDLFNKDGKLHNDIIIYLNKRTTYPEQLAKPVEDGDELSISVLIGGG